MADKDIETSQNDDQVDFDTQTLYKLKELEFGGFIAFDPEHIHCYRKKIKNKVVFKKLRKPMKVTALTNIDQYD